MQNFISRVLPPLAGARHSQRMMKSWRLLPVVLGVFAALPAFADATDPSDPVLNLLLDKGVITQKEADNARAQAAAIRSNSIVALPPMESKWDISHAIKNVELFGDVRVRYEDRQAETPVGGKIDLQRERYSVRFGLRGKALDDFYYGVRLETSANPRSAWGTFGTSSSGLPYQGPYGKSTFNLDIGQAYMGWRPEEWVDLTVGKMPNPLYTTSMVWDGDLNPEGLAERFHYQVGAADFFATFGQFVYQDTNPNQASGGLGFNGLTGLNTDNIFQLAWQGGLTYHITTNISAKVAATIYQYYGLQSFVSPYYGDVYVGEGQYQGPGSSYPVNGSSGYGTSYTTVPGSPNSLGYPNNQVGLNDLLVLEIPFEVNFKLKHVDARVFGDFAYNLEGKQRAEKAAAAYSYYLANYSTTPATISGFAPQTDEVKAYQIGFAIGSPDSLGLVSGSTCRKHAWEVRTYWQHVEQYALDPNLLDSDFFEGRANLEGVYAAVAYGFTDNVIGAVRYGYAHRINNAIGTGGSNQDIPQINPIDNFSLFQVDLILKF